MKKSKSEKLAKIKSEKQARGQSLISMVCIIY
jgi:hypothetical protein